VEEWRTYHSESEEKFVVLNGYQIVCKILIDHNSKDGFEAIAHARQYMLEMGKSEFEDPDTINWPIRGSHVLAPVSVHFFQRCYSPHI
jgi:hypothetical protein